MGAKRRVSTTEQPQNTTEPQPEEPAQPSGQQQEDASLPLQPPIHHQCLALHRSRHWQWSPSSVVAISACPAAPLAAIGFETGDLELWDLVHITCIQRIVGEGVEITALTWACDSLDGSWRTFCAALDGSLAEVKWKSGKLVASSDSGAGAIWALAAQPASAVAPGFAHPLAASCDDGSVRVFHVEGGESGAHYSRTLARLQGRALAVAWHPSGSALVAGGADGCIHVLDPSNGVEHLRITAGAATARPVCVWRLAVLPSGTIVSGDSDGAVQFWDGRFGSLLHRFTQHRADVLAVVPSPDGEAVFASGVDPAVALFRHAQGDAPNTLSAKSVAGAAQQQQQQSSSRVGAGGGHWVYTHHKRPHTHDVRAMDVVRLGGGRAVLLSGGVDAQLIAYPVASFLEEHPARLTKCPQRPICQLALGSHPPTPTSSSSVAADSNGNGVGATPKKRRTQVQHSSQQQQQQFSSSTQPPLLLCAQHDTVDVWQLARTVAEQHSQPQLLLGDGPAMSGGANGGADVYGVEGVHHACMPIAGETVDLTSGPRHLARIRCGAGRISTCAISPDGRFVAAVGGPQGRVRVYQLLPEHSSSTAGLANGGGGPAAGSAGGVARVKLPPLEPCSTLTFTHGYLLLAHTDGSLSALSLPYDPHQHQHHQSPQPKATPPSTARIVAKLGPRDAGSQQQAHQVPSSMGAVHAGETELGGAQAASAWRGFAAPVSHLVAAPNGETLAVAGAGGISLVRLTRSTANTAQQQRDSQESSSSSDEDDKEETHREEGGRAQQGAGVSMAYSGKLLRVGHDAPLTSLAFSADSEVLAATLASGNLVIYECASGRPSTWSVEHATEIAACLERLPGTPVGLSFSPDPASRTLIVYSPGGFCTLDTRRAPDCAAAQRSRHSSQKRRRGPLPPHLHHRSGELASLGGGEVAGGPCLDAAPGLRKAGLPGGSGSSGNGRAILLRDPCAFLGHLSPNEAILLEKPWEDVASTFTPPLYTHRYGA